MKRKSKRLKPIAFTIAALLATAGFMLTAYAVDYHRICRSKPPVFAWRVNALNDGGTSIYCGMFYHIVEWHSFADSGYICGYDINFGFDYGETIAIGARSGETINFRIENQ